MSRIKNVFLDFLKFFRFDIFKSVRMPFFVIVYNMIQFIFNVYNLNNGICENKDPILHKGLLK